VTCPSAPTSRTAGPVVSAAASAATHVVELAEDAASTVVGKAGDVASTVVGKAGGAASTVAGKASDAAEAVVDIAETAATPIASVAKGVGGGVAGARERWEASRAGRRRQLRAAARRPLPSLWEEHPGASQAALRDLGIHTLALDNIKGTAVAGPVQRRGDFLPLPKLRGTNWDARWQRIRGAVDRLEYLPPIDVIKYGDDYWVVDGHNRVAAALQAGVVGIDASVIELRQPGATRTSAVGSLAPIAEQGRELRAAGEGRLSRTAVPREELGVQGDGHEHPPEPAGEPQPRGT
jgi:hypothetical protein